jgi:branched-chain amino acid transport system ATP-binding protein
VAPLLEVERLTAGYGRVEVLRGVSLAVPEGSVVAVLGPNGMGKTTLMRAISGTLPIWRGRVRVDGRRVDGLSAFEVARRGITLVPEGRGVFPGLTVEDNLAISARADTLAPPATRKQRLERVFEIFPRLAERTDQRAGTLSGGEQQMLSLSRAFLANPRILMMDEISMGLAPKLVEELFAAVERLKEAGTTMLIVEQYLTYALRLADICYVLNKGRVDFVGEPFELEGADVLGGAYLSA